VRVKAVGSHQTAGPSESPTRRYTMVDVGLGWQVTSRSRVLAAFRNLLDEAYQSSAGPRWVWAPGRHGAVTLVISY
jgi:outer membrane receptor protein involved in Fe transport